MQTGRGRLHCRMIVSFRHKGLELLYAKGSRRRVSADHADKIERILQRLDDMERPEALVLPGFRMHRLRGDLAGFWSVVVSGNWRIIFQFDGVNVYNVDLVDYH